MGMRVAGRLAEGAVERRGRNRFRQWWRPSDPVKFFLTERRRAHCELFASATVLLLRSAGVPARYVSGFICNEPHPSGKYFIARYGDAHAWVEAYDRQNRKWVIVDTTPPSVTAASPRPDSWQERIASRGDYLRLSWFEILSSLRRGHFADGGTYNVQNMLTVAEMLTAWTRNGQYNCFNEERLGTLEAGKLADIAVLDADVFTLPVEQVKDVKVALTISDGRIVYNAL